MYCRKSMGKLFSANTHIFFIYFVVNHSNIRNLKFSVNEICLRPFDDDLCTVEIT